MPKKVKADDWEVPTKIYCLRCKAKTSNNGDAKLVVTANKRVMAQVPCAKCDTKKNCILGMQK